MTEFRMPSLGADMEAGTLVQWLKHPGDPVTRGDIIAVVDTQKGAIEIEVFVDGVLEQVVVPPGQQVPVGTVLALIREAPGTVAPPTPPGPSSLPGTVPSERKRVSPAARRAADTLHLDLAGVEGTGPGGAVSLDDVERAAARAATPAVVRPAGDRAGAMRSAIAAAMARSKREIPHLYLSTTIDMSRPLAWLSSENQTRAVATRLLPVVLLLKAVGRAAAEVREVNGHWVDGGFHPGAGIHVGCAIALREGGLVAPALHDVDRKALDTLMHELHDLVSRTRAGSLRSSELADPTITVTNLGDLGVESAFGVIYPPQVALVAFGRVIERPWVSEGRVEPRPLLTATLSADHRVVDGRQAGLFLGAVNGYLQQPETL